MLYQNGKKRTDIIAEYDLTKFGLDRWIKPYQSSGEFTTQANRSVQENELTALPKENKRLLMENSGVDNRRKIKLITENQYRYSLRVLCRYLHILKNRFYYQSQLISKKQIRHLV